MNEASLKSDYESRIPKLNALGFWVVSQIQRLVKKQFESHQIPPGFFQIPLKHRVKSVDSFLQKALFRKKYDNPLDDTTDQVGVRIVVLLIEDIDKVGEAIRSGNWDCDKARDHQQERASNPNYFAYQSDHYVIRVKKDFTYRKITIPKGMACEIQVRTILQHAYAEMAHVSSYKPTNPLPFNHERLIARALAKGSALIETTDDVFKQIKGEIDKFHKGILELLKLSCKLYKDATTLNLSPSNLSMEIAYDYREYLANVDPSNINSWFNSNEFLANRLKLKCKDSVLFRDPIVILIAYLISVREMDIPKKWNYDRNLLDDVYRMIGKSPIEFY